MSLVPFCTETRAGGQSAAWWNSILLTLFERRRPVLLPAALFCALLALAAAAAESETLTGKVIGVHDGDTLSLLDPSFSTTDLFPVSKKSFSRRKLLRRQRDAPIGARSLARLLLHFVAGAVDSRRSLVKFQISPASPIAHALTLEPLERRPSAGRVGLAGGETLARAAGVGGARQGALDGIFTRPVGRRESAT